MRLLSGLAAAAVLATGLVGVGVPVAAPAAADDCESITATDDEVEQEVEGESPLVDELQVQAAHDWLRARGRAPGRGVRIGVVDSGISPKAPVDVDGGDRVYDSKRPPSTDLFPRGTAVAGLVAGAADGDELVGLAPEAEVVDIAVYDNDDVGEEQGDDDTPLETANVAAGLRFAAGVEPRLDIVTVALEVEDSPELREAVTRLTRLGIVVVAASGDLPLEGGPFDGEFGEAGDDAAQEIFPAGYAAGRRPDPLVVAATSTVPDGADPREYVLPSSATTVAVPTESGVSYAVNGARCTLPEPRSKWAAATVSGVLALIASAYPRETGAQWVARLTETAAGPATSSGPNGSRFLGRGVVQPLEALTREIDPRPDGEVPRLEQPAMADEPAAVDPPPADPLASAREDAVWWALGFGGLIAVLLLLRPVIGRRRHETGPRT